MECFALSEINHAFALKDLQEKIMSITGENVSSVCESILIFGQNNANGFTDIVTSMLLLHAQYRTTHIETLVKLVVELIRHATPENRLLEIKPKIFRLMSSKFREVWPIYMIDECYQVNAYTDDEIISEIALFTNTYPTKYFLEKHLLFYWFAPLLEARSPDIFNSILTSIRSEIYNDILHPFYQDFIRKFDRLRKDNWKLHRHIYLKGSFEEILSKDDFERFQQIIRKPDFDINGKFPITTHQANTILSLGSSYINFAAYYGSKQIFNYLYQMGANLHTKDQKNRNTAHFSVAGGHIDLIEVCEKQNVCFEGTGQIAAEYHQNDIFQWIYDTKEVKLDVSTDEFQSIFHQSVVGSNFNVVLFCLEHGCDINTKNNEGKSVLHVAAESHHTECLKFLLQHRDANVNAMDHNKFTPLHIAAYQDNGKAVEYLLQNPRVDVNAIDIDNVYLYFIILLFI